MFVIEHLLRSSTSIHLVPIIPWHKPRLLNPLLFCSVTAKLGASVTLPCIIHSYDTIAGYRIEWTKVNDKGTWTHVLLSISSHRKANGNFNNRVFLGGSKDEDGSLVIKNVSMGDNGRYRCEIQNGEEDVMHDIILKVESRLLNGVVFPYSPHGGRYSLNFEHAEKACADQGAVVASFDQLYEAWEDGLDWCNAGWLNDGTVQYPITKPREPCGGSRNGSGLRSYGQRNKKLSRFDVFCYASKLRGEFFWLSKDNNLSFNEAVQACLGKDAEIAKVGHMFAAWKLEEYNHCNAGWLADGSVRYPVSKPRKNCSPTEAAVRLVGFPDKKKKYGVYCFRPEQ
uniref:Hyaluronan and proteoglycan link protein 1a n=1 Tax=Oryzias latipes TaxID=8090 RepID=A0A3P9INT2_ORYLA